MKQPLLLLAILAGAMMAAPGASEAQVQKVHRLGFLGTAYASGYVRELEWIRDGLRKAGYVEGRNITIEYRWAEGNPARSREIAAEFVSQKVDAILVHGVPGALAAAKETSTIPIIMADGGDPIAAGLGASVARPGRNVTGSFSFTVEEVGKRLGLLKEAQPKVKQIGWIVTPMDFALEEKRKTVATSASSVQVAVQEFVVRDGADLPGTFNAMTKAGVDSVLVNNEPLLNSHAGAIAALAAAMKLPAVGYATFADAGGLLAYGANRPALYGRVGYFLDRILKGTKPGDIPFERAARFDVVVNLKTAKTLGVTIPQSILARADRVIQ